MLGGDSEVLITIYAITNHNWCYYVGSNGTRSNDVIFKSFSAASLVGSSIIYNLYWVLHADHTGIARQ